MKVFFSKNIKNQGFSLLEVILALLILAFLSLYMFNLVYFCSNSMEHTSNLTLANSTAVSVIENIRLRKELLQYTGSVEVNEKDLIITVPDNMRVKYIVGHIPQKTNLKEVTVIVTWEANGVENNLTLKTVMFYGN